MPGLSPTKEEIAPIPKKIGPYKVEGLLSKGGMSLLYLGLDPEKKVPLAIKVLSPKFVNHPEALDRFFQEAKIITMASHPNIVTIYGEGKWEGGLYIAMELIQGISLRQFIKQRSLSLKRSLEIVLQVAYALCHLHTHGVIHRDLKPENIMITENGAVKVIDFGVAQLHEEKGAKKGKPSPLVGSPHYMSPEQKENPSKASFTSDIYSLGLIAYELIIGQHDYSNWLVGYGTVNLSGLPKNLRAIIEKALAVSVSSRYQDIVDFITDLSAYLKSKELLEERPGSDQFQELVESLHSAELSLTPQKLPETPACDVGVAKQKEPGSVGYYYDLFKLNGNMYALVLAHCEHDKLESTLYLANLRGVLRSSFLQFQRGQSTFAVTNFLTNLSNTLFEEPLDVTYNFSLLVLDPSSDELVFTSCGSHSLFLVPQGSHDVRELISDNPPLGKEPFSEFSIISDNWRIGDLLTLSSFPTNADLSKQTSVKDAILNSNTLSPNRQADAILKGISFANASPTPSPEIALTVRRIG